jgi:hypothetical protein
MTLIAAPPQVTRHHRDDRFLDFLIVLVVLYDHRGTDLRSPWFREGEIYYNDVTSLDHRFIPYFC